MMGCGTPSAGPKVIHADGRVYTACGGVLSVPSARDKVESDPGSYEAFFEDLKALSTISRRSGT
jgi:hypothetical protein